MRILQQGCESIQLRRMIDSRMMCIMAEGWVMKCLPYLPAIPGKYDLLKISTSFANGCQKLLIAVDIEISSPQLALVCIIHQLPSEHWQITSPHAVRNSVFLDKNSVATAQNQNLTALLFIVVIFCQNAW